MLFVLDSSLDVIASDPNHVLHDELWIQLNALALARRHRKLAVFIESVALYSSILRSPYIGKQAKSIYSYLNRSRTFKKSLLEKLSVRVRIVGSSEDIASSLNQGITEIRVPIGGVPFGLFDSPILLAENIADARAYVIFSKIALGARIPSLPQIELSIETRGGGGSAIFGEYKNIKDAGERLMLCVLDSDVRYPEAPTNPTNIAIINEQRNAPSALTNVSIIDVYSIENLFPLDSFQQMKPFCEDDGAMFRLAKERQHLDVHSKNSYWRYIRLKKGIECAAFRDTQDLGAFWAPLKSTLTDFSSKQCEKDPAECRNNCARSPSYHEDSLKHFVETFGPAENRVLGGLYKSVPRAIEECFVNTACLVASWSCVGNIVGVVTAD